MAIDWDALVVGPTMGVFGDAVTYRPAAGAPFDITGIYDEGNKQLMGLDDGSAGLNESGPVLGVQLSQFPSPPLQNDQLYVNTVAGVVINRTFVVRDVQPDSHGAAKLMLYYVRVGP